MGEHVLSGKHTPLRPNLSSLTIDPVLRFIDVGGNPLPRASFETQRRPSLGFVVLAVRFSVIHWGARLLLFMPPGWN
jgi:hypothetical protein